MKEIKEEIKREITDIHISYEAFDGTKFNNKEECVKYEDTAICVLKAKLRPLIVTEEFDAWEIMGGYEDHTIFGLNLPTPDDADALKHWLLLDRYYLNKDEYKERKDKLFAKIDSAIGDICIMGIDCEGDWYVINSRKNIIDNLTNLDKKGNDSEGKIK